MPAGSNTDLYIGMLSGTSRDGADVALVSFSGDDVELVESRCVPYPHALSEELTELIASATRPQGHQLVDLHRRLGEFFGQSALSLLDATGLAPSDIAAVGSHGQTVWHEPPESIQLGDPGIIAGITGIKTVGDFRRADLDAGGQGAPLAPLLHRQLFKPNAGTRAILNIGGIANLSLLDSTGNVSGFDTGPGNCLMDAWISDSHGRAFDKGGEWARKGTVIRPLLMALLEDPYFSRLPPKSTGVEYFNLQWLRGLVDTESFDTADIQATLAELTARSIAHSIPDSATEVLICGGGVHNHYVMNRLSAAMPRHRVGSTAEAGLDPDAAESILFAWLARERIAEHAQDTTSITGASHSVLLGSVYLPE